MGFTLVVVPPAKRNDAPPRGSDVHRVVKGGTGLTALLDDVQARVGNVVVLEFLSLLKGVYQDRVVLGGNEGDCVETEWWRHFKRVVRWVADLGLANREQKISTQ